MTIEDRKTKYGGVTYKKLVAQVGQLHTAATAAGLDDEAAKARYGLLRKAWTSLGALPVGDGELQVLNGCVTLFAKVVPEGHPLLKAAVETVRCSIAAMAGDRITFATARTEDPTRAEPDAEAVDQAVADAEEGRTRMDPISEPAQVGMEFEDGVDAGPRESEV